MALNMGRRMLLVLLVSLCFLHYASSQQVAPSNDTIPNDDHTYVLQTTEGSMVTSTRIEPLAPDAKLNTVCLFHFFASMFALTTVQQQSITGQLVLATAQTVSSVAQGNIAYISCDPSAYPGNIDATHTINIAVSQNPRAIILFSNTSAACTFKPTNIFTFSVIYTMVEANRSSQLQDEIEAASPHPAPVQIQMGSLGGNATTTTQSQGIGHSPTTAVAMIILYSITGIITALFLIIIIVGAIRAHRHPERYGPQNMLGRPRQSRARGIARAMLDTLPIVKFGEREEDKIVQPAPHGSNPQARDIELGNPLGEARPDQHQATIPPRTSAEQTTVARDGPTHDGSEPVTTETVAGTDQLPAGEAQTDSHADNGLACSVCTDDFVKGQDIRVLPCNHKFHPECIDPWLLNVSGTCPMWYVRSSQVFQEVILIYIAEWIFVQ